MLERGIRPGFEPLLTYLNAPLGTTDSEDASLSHSLCRVCARARPGPAAARPGPAPQGREAPSFGTPRAYLTVSEHFFGATDI